MGIGGRVGFGKGAVDYPLVAALDRGSVDGQVERCHDVDAMLRSVVHQKAEK